MRSKSCRLTAMIFFAIFQVSLLSSPMVAAPTPKSSTIGKPKRIIFTPPVYDAKTIQVTEVMYQADLAETRSGIAYGPLLQTGTATLRMQLPRDPTSDDWPTRTDWQEKQPNKSSGYCIEAKSGSVYFADGKVQPFPKSGGLWTDPMLQLIVGINDHRERVWSQAVATIPAVRDGKIVLLSANTLPSDPREQPGLLPKTYSEDWYDPKTHLILRRTMFSIWHGKTQQIMRTDYSGWALDVPIPASLFAVPPGTVQEK